MKPQKRRKYPPFVAISRDCLKSEEWRQLSNTAKVLYLHVKYKFVGTNNGEIKLHYSELKGLMSSATVAKAFKELVDGGWLERKSCGGMYRYSNKYLITGKYDKTILNYGF